MKLLPVALLLLYPLSAHTGNTAQEPKGWCSPAVAHTQGDVTIECHGVDPQAQHRLNESPDKKDLELQGKLNEAKGWTREYQIEEEARNLLGKYIRYAKEKNYETIKILYLNFDVCENCQKDLNTLKANMKVYKEITVVRSQFNNDKKTLKLKIKFGLSNYYEPTFYFHKTKSNQLKIKEVYP